MPTPAKGASQRHVLFMPVRRHNRKTRFVASFLLVSLVSELIAPNISYALTGGPTQPDFGSFEPVATTNMVNDFTGQFVYNLPVLEIPGGHGGGYALSLSYHSGDGPEAEASWVGAGWTLNPGSISRTRRGLPDDYKDKSVKYYNNMPKNWTVSATGVLGATETFSKMGGLLGGSISGSIRYNNYKGYGFAGSVGLGVLRGLASIGYSSRGGGTFSVAVNPAAALSYAIDIGKSKGILVGGNTASRNSGAAHMQQAAGDAMLGALSTVGSATSRYIGYLLTDMASPYNVTPYTGNSVSGSVLLTGNLLPVQIGVSAGISVSYTSQTNTPERTVKAYGYMYSGNAKADGLDNSGAGKAVINDYTIDRPSPYNERDLYLPVPVSTPDAYFVSGEGVGGAFRMYNDRIGIYSPNYVESITNSTSFGADIHLGMTLGGGGFFLGGGDSTEDMGGDHSLKVQSKWPEGNGNANDFSYLPYDYRDAEHQIYEGHFFRFNNDPGGRLSYGEINIPQAAGIGNSGPSIPAGMMSRTGTRRSGRSSYIGYRTNKELNQKNSDGKRVLAYELNERVHKLAGRNLAVNDSLRDLIGEISIYNDNGNNYVYGLPVYGREEKQMMHGVTGASGNYIVNANISENYKKVGEEYNSPYVTSYLLTQITTPDYVDINLNGPDSFDLGGYTRFSYAAGPGQEENKLGTPFSSPYKWRIPYSGVYFHANRLSDNTDNMGSYQSGIRESYYLDTIETKTHFAVFIKNSLTTREDGYGAHKGDIEAANGAIPTNVNQATHHVFGSQRPAVLDMIRLYAKSTRPGEAPQLIKTVRFQYEQRQWPGTPNSYHYNVGNSPSQPGKLTLKRVWFEYNGVYNAAISPYEFEYNYPSHDQAPYPSQHQYILDEMNDGKNQNPNYTAAVDCWGNYQSQGDARRAKMLCSPDQTPAKDFDPAAWQLKRIILPSGGEIHVQYEQGSYGYVQDRPAMVLMPLTNTIGSTNDADGNTFEINTNDVGITDPGDKARLVKLINKTYKDKKIYYKFLFTLMGGSEPNISSCNAEYIDGYAVFKEARINGTGNVEVEMGDELPRKVCVDYLQREVGGRISEGNCDPSGSVLNDPGTDQGSLRGMALQLINAIGASLAPSAFSCKKISASMSYLRIPVWKKLGGGIRVKRLLMYNNSAYGGPPGVYGHEYVYENEQTGESYGVATNEPPENREENPMVDYLDKRAPQSKRSRNFDGRDRDQFEGPLSMSAMPGASVGYSRVIKKNIHQDKFTGGGYTVMDYYTAKDYPFDGYYGALGMHGVEHTEVKRNAPDPQVEVGIFSYSIKNKMRSTQGYAFIQNQMHGQIRSVAEYPGTYSAAKHYSSITPQVPVSQTVYEYFEPGEEVPMFNSSEFGVYYDQPGKEMDVTVEQRCVLDQGSETVYSGDITFGNFVVIWIPYIFGSAVTSTNKTQIGSVVTSKVMHYPAIVRRISVTKDGFVKRQEHTAFDPLTLQPVVTRTYDGHHGLMLGSKTEPHQGIYTDFNILASSQYPQMGQKAWNERYSYYTAPGNYIAVNGLGGGQYSVAGINANSMFKEGDLVALHHSTGIALITILDASNANLTVAPAGRYNSTIPTSGANYWKAEVIRSGYTNQLTASMGGLTTYSKNQLALTSMNGMSKFAQEMTKAWLRVKDSNAAGNYGYVGVVSLSGYNFTLHDLDFYFPGPYEVGACYDTTMVSKLEIHSTGPNTYQMESHLANWPGNYGTPPTINGVSRYTFSGSPAFSDNGWWGDGCPKYSVDQATAPYGFGFTNIWTRDWCTWCYDPDYTTITYKPHLYFTDPVLGKCVQFFLRACYDGGSSEIIRANVTTYRELWPHDNYVHSRSWPSGLNDYEKNIRNKWRPHQTFVYNDKAYEGSHPGSGQRNYLSGTVYDFRLEPWGKVFAFNRTKWLRTSIIDSYTPHGQALEERHADSTYYSAVKYGYYHTLPYISVKNAMYNAVRFESFEMIYDGGKLEDGVTPPAASALYATNVWHTGRRCYELKSNNTISFTGIFDNGDGHVIRVWARYNGTAIPLDILDAGGNSLNPKYVTRSGQWALYEAYSTPAGGTLVDYSVRLNTGSSLYIDDIRIQPVNSEMTTYVYDVRNYKMSAVLDDQNFATYYQYNGEGKLVRKMLETERGVRTIDEVHLNTPKIRDRTSINDNYGN